MTENLFCLRYVEVKGKTKMSYTQQQWTEIYSRSCGRMESMLEGKMPKVMIRNEARMLLNACYGGPWRAIAQLIWYQVKSLWEDFTFNRFGFVRTKVLRRIPSPALEIAERVADEERALNEMAREL